MRLDPSGQVIVVYVILAVLAVILLGAGIIGLLWRGFYGKTDD